jgi:hypothetical protein
VRVTQARGWLHRDSLSWLSAEMDLSATIEVNFSAILARHQQVRSLAVALQGRLRQRCDCLVSACIAWEAAASASSTRTMRRARPCICRSSASAKVCAVAARESPSPPPRGRVRARVADRSRKLWRVCCQAPELHGGAHERHPVALHDSVQRQRPHSGRRGVRTQGSIPSPPQYP